GAPKTRKVIPPYIPQRIRRTLLGICKASFDEDTASVRKLQRRQKLFSRCVPPARPHTTSFHHRLRKNAFHWHPPKTRLPRYVDQRDSCRRQSSRLGSGSASRC